MAILDFPSSPTSGQTYSANGLTYIYNGTYWTNTAPNVTTSGLPVISETVTSGSQASVTISNIPQTYRDLKVVVSGRGTNASTGVVLKMQVNGDTGSNYDYQYADGSGTTATAGQGYSQSYIWAGDIAAASSPANVAGVAEVTLYNYANTTFQKNYQSTSHQKWGNTTATAETLVFGGDWRSTAAITSIVVFPSAGAFADGTVISVYGIGGASAVNLQSGGGGAQVWVGTVAPSSPTAFPMWWKSDEGVMLIYYNDGNSSQWVGFNPLASTVQNDYGVLHLQEQQAATTEGGTFTSGSWVTRVLNTAVLNTIPSATGPTSNQFVLPAGTYDIQASSPAHQVESHQIRLQNITDGTTTLLGMAARSRNTTNTDGTSTSEIMGRFVITSSKTFELQHRCSTTLATNGLGVGGSVSWGTVVYSNVFIKKIA